MARRFSEEEVKETPEGAYLLHIEGNIIPVRGLNAIVGELLRAVKSKMTITRFKGLGEMNPDQL